MNVKKLLASIALASAASSSMATLPSCTSTTTWNSLGPPDIEAFGHSFTSGGSYTDCYTFSLSSAANAFGGTLELGNVFKIDVTSVSLFLGDSLIGTDDSSDNIFTFSNLAGGGLYTLAVASTIGKDPILASYVGLITTIAAPVPEPGALALMIAGLIGVGSIAWRRKGA
jgi:hypothetical protein